MIGKKGMAQREPGEEKSPRTFAEKWNWLFIKLCSLFILLLVGYLGYWALNYTHGYGDLKIELVSGFFDSPVRNLLFVLAACAICFLIAGLILRGPEEVRKRRVRWIQIAAIVLYGICLLVWVNESCSAPAQDQLQVVLTARAFMRGNYAEMDAYMDLYPQQYTLCFFYELLFRIWNDWRFLQYWNIVFILLMVWFSCEIAEELFHSPGIKLFCLLGMIFLMPLFFYVTFVYGDIPSISLCILGIWSILKWLGPRGRRLHAGIALLSATLAVLLRLNSLVVLLAVLITLAFYSLEKRRWQPLVLAVLMIAIPLVCSEGIKSIYEIRSGKEISEGIPAILWIAMGMQDSWDGAGVYNGFNNSTYVRAAGRDSEKAFQIGFDFVRGRAKELLENPSMALEFYRKKILCQWNEHSYGCLIMTHQLKGDPGAFVQSVYYGDIYERLWDFMNHFIFLRYVCIFVWALYALIRSRGNVLSFMIPLAFIGGFLFSILWEAKSRYVFPYVVLMIPYVAFGMETLRLGLGAGISRIRRRFLIRA